MGHGCRRYLGFTVAQSALKVTHWLLLVLILSVVACGPAQRPHNIRHVTSYYHVRPGDTLYTIAWKYNIDVQDLMGWNRLKPPYTIYPGQKLTLSPPPGYRPPARASSQPQVAQKRPSTASASTTPPARSQPSPTAAKKQATPAAPPTARVEAKKPQAPVKLHWRWPLKGPVVARFGSGPGQQGIRIRGSQGQAVMAAESGKVVYSGNGLKGYRELVIIQHSADFLTAYAYNRRRFVVEGEMVKRGQKVAELGDPHTNAPELHFELRYRGKPVDPLRYLPRR